MNTNSDISDISDCIFIGTPEIGYSQCKTSIFSESEEQKEKKEQKYPGIKKNDGLWYSTYKRYLQHYRDYIYHRDYNQYNQYNQSFVNK